MFTVSVNTKYHTKYSQQYCSVSLPDRKTIYWLEEGTDAMYSNRILTCDPDMVYVTFSNLFKSKLLGTSKALSNNFL